MDKNYPIISVVIPCYKAEKYITRAVRSVLEQKDVYVQLIVVEDGKFDNAEAVLAQYMPQIEFISLEKNRGACYARNMGLTRAKADFVMFLDADDYIEGPLLRSLFNALANGDASVAFGEMRLNWENSKKVKIYKPIKDKDSISVIIRWISGMSGPNPSSILWRKSEVIRIGGWNESYSKNQDGEIIVRAMFNGCSVVCGDKGFGVAWQHNNERVSNGIDDRAFESLKMFELYIENEFVKKKLNTKRHIIALNVYRINTARRAYSYHKDEYGKYFEKNWIKSEFNWISFSFIGLKYSDRLKKYFLYNLFFRFAGIKRVNIIISYIKKLANK